MGLVMMVKLQPVTGHLALQKEKDHNALTHLWATLNKKKYVTGYIATALLPLGGFMLMPFGSAFAEYNLGVPEEQLPWIFLATGVASMAVFPILGRLSDKYNKVTIFAIASAWSIVMVIVHTHWFQIPMWLVLLSNIFMFAGIMGRIVPSTILISAMPEMKDRGAFMAINSSLQQAAGGIASIIAGYIVTQETPTSVLHGIDTVGFVVAGITLISIYVIYRVYNLVKDQLPPPRTKQAEKKPEPVLVAE
jgi:predicted MFS family arabinose efflux permease